MKDLKKPIGLFLAGGGAFGSWQAGVMKELINARIEFDAIAGFSIGALNGSAYCFGKDWELESLWRGIKTDKILKISPKYSPMPLELFRHYSDDLMSRIKFNLSNHLARISVYSNEPIYNFFDSWFREGTSDFVRPIPLYIISHCVERKLPYIAKFDGNGNNSNISFRDALVSSCSIPSVFPPVKIMEGNQKIHLVDGGVIGIADINLKIFEGCKTIIFISNSRDDDMNFKSPGIAGFFEERARKMLLKHVNNIYASRTLIKSKPDVYFISPPESLNMGILDFEGEKCGRAFDIGVKEALRILNE
ncbi:MAG: patatin-like phospholipase family protein [Elusimicrobiota bacterium]|nr:patatin-like phospholipase family protein [Elusimicrobiota bacterium]